MHPTLEIEFVAMKRNVGELKEMTKLAAELQASRLIVTNVLPYTEEMLDEVLYGYEPQPPLVAQEDAGWPVANEDWMFWGTVDLPRMHWSAERRCKFIHENATVVGWDGGVTPCYALSHSYSYYALGKRLKNVTRYVLGNVNEKSLAEIWKSEEYVKFRSEVRTFHFPSCPDCDLRDTCDLRENNEGCWGWNPSCADFLWAQDIIKCP
jgi:radical SAM protein with 4Fe4S-binding SPASM domain